MSKKKRAVRAESAAILSMPYGTVRYGEDSRKKTEGEKRAITMMERRVREREVIQVVPIPVANRKMDRQFHPMPLRFKVSTVCTLICTTMMIVLSRMRMKPYGYTK